MNISDYSDYIIFADESGDHGLIGIDPQYPIFVLVFVLIKKKDYFEKIIPAFEALKFKYWGHDQIILHERDIRKENGAFSILRSNAELREIFMQDLSQLIKNAPFEYVISVIHKDNLIKKYAEPFNPYSIGLLFCLEKLLTILNKRGQKNKKTHVLIEARGKKEDKELGLEFLRICANQNNWGYKHIDFKSTNLEPVMVDKKSNSVGLQLADLIARPLGLKFLRPEQANKTHEILKNKCGGIKTFP